MFSVILEGLSFLKLSVSSCCCRELESQSLEAVKATVISFDKRHFNTKYYVSQVTRVCVC